MNKNQIKKKIFFSKLMSLLLILLALLENFITVVLEREIAFMEPELFSNRIECHRLFMSKQFFETEHVSRETIWRTIFYISGSPF